MTLQVIQDPDVGWSGVVDTDTSLSWGPAAPGPDGAAALTDWIASLDYDLSEADPRLAQSLFAQWLHKSGRLDAMGAERPQEVTGADLPSTPGAEAALAQHEAQNAADGPPPPQPADTDPTATAGPTPPESPDPGTAGGPAAPAATGNGEPAQGGSAEGRVPSATPTPAPATVSRPCPNCNGQGTITHTDQNGAEQSAECGMCHGAGTIQVQAPA